MVKRKK
jgi:hypothetical protein